MPNLIFDFDGVIGDTYEATIQAHLRIGVIKDREMAISEMNRYFSSKPNHSRDHDLTPEEMQKQYDWISQFGKHVVDIGFELFTDFVTEIEKLKTSNMAVVSSGSQQYVLPALAKTEIRFSHILAYENHHSKEEKIETICRDWGVNESEVNYFTDSLADVYELNKLISPDKLIGVSAPRTNFKPSFLKTRFSVYQVTSLNYFLDNFTQ